MNTSIFIANRLREVFLNGKWIANTNYKEQLEAIGFEVAIKERNGLNSIAKLTFHINYYVKGILDAFKNKKLEISDRFSFDLPEMNNEEEWSNLINAFLKNAEELSEFIEHLDDAKWKEPFIDPRYGSLLRNIEGMIEHSYYHLGQIVLIRKLHYS